MKWLDDINMDKVTKRSMLSTVHKVFDPFGFISPEMLCPKIILQKAWKLGTSWDEELTELRKEFVQWFQEIKYLSDIQIFRYIQMSHEASSSCAIHTFADGTAKSQVALLRGATIPRMELPAVMIGARLTNSVVKALGWRKVTTYYWSDSTTVLAWVERRKLVCLH
ncbi:DUF1758 domain-containing protein [Trichonephila clavipes]|uniref:DUF1758 domain-containing protein n=1 Tax=Trichonephila clavipes TaxID=2585209 RepID=A0A8X6VDI4_TRICX|nr:DUF1758 domain-containing protein [Trichonephila clavipes]